MPYSIERKTVSNATWWNPLTWTKRHVEVRRVWDMDQPLLPKDIPLFVGDGCSHSKWEKEVIK